MMPYQRCGAITSFCITQTCVTQLCVMQLCVTHLSYSIKNWVLTLRNYKFDFGLENPHVFCFFFFADGNKTLFKISR